MVRIWLALCHREWLEHRGAYLWSLLGALALFVLVVVLVLVGLHHASPQEIGLEGSGSGLQQAVQALLGSEAWRARPLAGQLEYLRQALTAPFAMVYFGVTVFVLLGMLFDERKDRTVLFWKSVPASDTAAVTSKLVTVVWFVPLLLVAVVVIAQLFLLTVLSLLADDSVQLRSGSLWAESGILLGAFELLVGYLVQGFWSLPIWAWLLLVSALVNRLPLLWALLVPVIPALLEWTMFGSTYLYDGISKHLDSPALPVLPDSDGGLPALGPGLAEMLALWTRSDMWAGIAVGLLLLAGAIYLRRRNNEI